MMSDINILRNERDDARSEVERLRAERDHFARALADAENAPHSAAALASRDVALREARESRDDWYRNCLSEQNRAITAEQERDAARAECERLKELLAATRAWDAANSSDRPIIEPRPR